MLAKISRADSNEDLAIAGLDPKYLAVLNNDDYLIIADAADERLITLADERLRKKAQFMGEGYKAALDLDKKELRAIYDNLNKIATLDKGIQNELSSLTRVSPLYWFNPGFQAAAKKNAHEMAPHFEKLNDGCNVIVGYLKPLSIALNHQLESLPSAAEMQALPANSPKKIAVENRRELLTRYLRRVNRELDLYEPLYKQLNGDPRALNPLLRQGILKTIQYAKDDKHALQFLSFASNYSDHPVDERAMHFQVDYQSAVDANHTALFGTTGAVYYQAIERSKFGYFREHVINPGDQYSGCFLEDRASNFDSAIYQDALKGYRPNIKLTINKFPEGPDPNDPQLVTARVQYAMAMATQLLAGFSEPPTKERPLILEGVNAEELRYVWTALVVVGREVPHFRFEPAAVEVVSAAYDSSHEMKEVFGFQGWKKQFTATSCYETRFKPQTALTRWLSGIKEASKDKADFKKESEQIKKIAGRISNTFFGTTKAKAVVEDLRKENKSKGPESGG